MAVVVDTNILVSWLIKSHGPPGRILDLILTDAIQVALDDRVLDEYSRVLGRPKFGFQAQQVGALMDYLEIAGVRDFADPLKSLALLDPTDLPFVEVAEACNASALITGNTEHFDCLRATTSQYSRHQTISRVSLPVSRHHETRSCSPAIATTP